MIEKIVVLTIVVLVVFLVGYGIIKIFQIYIWPGLPPGEEELPHIWEKIEKFAEAILSEEWKEVVEENPVYAGGKVFPVPGGTFTNDWGDPREGGKRKHLGIDIFAKEGTPVMAFTSGKVEKIGCNRLGGNRIGIRGEDGNYYYYGHLSAYYVSLGQKVRAGQRIGDVGSTIGCESNCVDKPPKDLCGIPKKTSPHLHFAIFLSNGKAINPYPYLKAVQK